MINQSGLDRFRDLLVADFSTAQLGSNGEEVKLSDTGVKTPITGTDKSVSTSSFHNGFKISYTTSEGDGSGNDAREWAAYNGESTPVCLLRSVFPAIEIASDTVIEVDTQILLLQEF